MDPCDTDYDEDEMRVARVVESVEPSVETALPNDESLDAAVNRKIMDEVRSYRGAAPELPDCFDAWVTDVTVGDDAGEFALPVPVDRKEYDESQTGKNAATLIDSGIAGNETNANGSGSASKTLCVLHGALESGHRVAVCVEGYAPKVTLLQKYSSFSVTELTREIQLLTGLPTNSFKVSPHRACKSYGWQPDEGDLQGQEVHRRDGVPPTMEASMPSLARSPTA